MISRLASIWSGNRTRNSSALRKSRRRPLTFDGLDRRVLLSSTWVEGPIGSVAAPQATSTQVVEMAAVRSEAQGGAIQGSPSTVLDSTVPTGYTPPQVRHAYGFDQIPLNGAGMTIAIIDPGHDPNAHSDLQAFDRQVDQPQAGIQNPQYFIPDPPSFTQVNESGQTSNYPTNQNSALSLETSLDVEWAHAIAPAASILLVEFNTIAQGDDGSFIANSSDIVTAINTARNYPGVVAVSMSFGGSISIPDSTFTTPSGHPGVTFLASTGDDGEPADPPATSPNVVSVGGTVLPLDSAGDYPGTGVTGEIGWNGSSGGLTSLSQPGYQKGVVTQSTTVRTNPDVAYNAGDGVAVYDSFADSKAPWISTEGTSAGSPQWAALVALADQGRSQAGLPALDGASQTLPLLYHLPSSAFHDITSGSNKSFSSGVGYDLVTGRGSPVRAQVVAGLTRPFTVAGGGVLLYQLDSTGNLWQYNPLGWEVLATGVTSFALGKPGTPWANGLFALKSDGELMETVGSGWNDIGYNVTAFALGNPGTSTGNWLYALKSDGELMATDGYGFSDIGYNVTSFAVGNPGTSTGNWLFALKSDGELMETDGYGWQDIGYNVTSFAVGNPGTSTGNWLFALKSDGELMETDGYGFSDIGYNVTSFAVGNPGTSTGNWLYALKTDGELMETDGYGFSDIATTVTSFALGNPSTPWAGDIFALKSDGELMESLGNGFSDIATTVTSFALGYGGTAWANGLFALKTDGELMESLGNGFSDIATTVTSFALGYGGTAWANGLFALKTDGELMETLGNGFFDIGYTTSSFQLGYDGTPWYGGIIALKTDGELMETLNNGFFDIGYTTSSFQLGYDGTPWYGGIIALKTDGELMETLGNGFFDIGYTTSSFQLGYDGTPWYGGIIALKTDGELMETLGNGFFDIGYTTSSFQLGYDGTPWANAIFALKSDGELMETLGNGFFDIGYTVTSFALGHAGTAWANDIIALKSDGELMTTVGNGFSDLDTGVKSFLVGSGGFLDVLESSGNLWQYSSPTTRSLLDQSVQSITLSSAGFIVNAVETTGKVRQFAT